MNKLYIRKIHDHYHLIWDNIRVRLSQAQMEELKFKVDMILDGLPKPENYEKTTYHPQPEKVLAGIGEG